MTPFPSHPNRGRRMLLEVLLAVLALGLVARFYYWTERTSGAFGPPDEEWDYYNLLVRGWRQGHLHLSKEPRPEMLALSDPYDPAQNHEVRFPDASFYRGHYYLYFSAVPAALLLWPYHVITGREMGTPTAVYIFWLIGFVAACAVWLALRRRYFPQSAVWVGATGVLMLGFGTQLLVLARRPVVWELPIASAYGFGMLTLLGIYAALHGRRPILAMAATGLCLGLAIASRPTQLFGALLILPVAWQLRRRPETAARWRAGAAAGAIALGACGFAVMAHNFARFGNPLEFGMRYQLTSNYEAKERHFGFDYIAHNARIYFLNPVQGSPDFPFVAATAVRGGPAGYLGNWVEPMAGLAVTFPFLWFAAGLALSWRGRPAEEMRPLRTLVLAIAWMFTGSAAFFLCFYCATPRYAVEFAAPLGLLALVGWLGLERWAQASNSESILPGSLRSPQPAPEAERGAPSPPLGSRQVHRGRKILVATIAIAACGATALVGLLLSFDYHDRVMRKLSPKEWSELEQFSNRLLGRTTDHK